MLRRARYVAAGLAIIVIVAATALGIYTHTDGFRELVRQKLMAAVNDSVRGKINVARIEGSVWGNLTLIDVELFYGNAEIARIPRLGINHSLLPLLWKRVQVFRLAVDNPLLRLIEEPNGKWNIVEAFSPVVAEPEKAPAQPSPWVVSLNSMELQKGDISISTKEQKNYRLRDVNLRGNLGLGLSGMSLNILQLSSRVAMDRMPEARVQGSLAYQTHGSSSASFEARDLSIESGSSRLTLAGKIKDLETLDTDARVSIEQLKPEDAVRFVPQWPVKSRISGTINIHGPASGLNGDFSLATADGKIGGKFNAALATDRPRYQGDITIARIDLYKLLGRDPIVGVISGDLKATGAGFELKDIAAEMDARVESTAIASWKLGDVFLKGKLENRSATVTGEVKSELGHAEWNSQIALEETPRYRVSLAADRLNIQKLAPQGKPPSGTLNLRAVVRGSGLSLAQMNAQTEIDLLPSTIANVKMDRGKLVAAVAGERIRVSEASLKAGDTTFNASGDMGTDVKQQGQLNYRLQIGRISPWLELLGRKGSGSVNVSGKARGNLSDVKTEGTLAAKSIYFGGTAIDRGSVNYTLNYLNREPNLQGRVSFDLADVRSGYHLQTLAGVVNILPKSPYSFDLQVRARDDQSRSHTIAANVQYQPAHIEARVTELTLNLPDGAWRLAQPATIAQQQNDFVVDRLTLQNNDRRLFLDGRFSLTGTQALRVSIDRLPIESLRSFYPTKTEITGLLSAQGQLSGTAAAPQIKATVKLENSQIDGQRYAGLFGTASYSGRTAEFKATLQQDQQHQLIANGTVPMNLSWQNGWRAESTGSLSGRIQSTGLSIGFLNAFSGKAIQEIDGEVALDVQIRGTLDRLLANGFVRLRDGKVSPRPLGIQIARITMEAHVEPSGVRIRQLSARSGDGELNGSGLIGLDNFVPQNVGLSIAAKNWPAINTQEYRAVMDGSLNVNGTVKAPRITGKLAVLNGELRPNLAFLEHGSTPTKRDPTIRVISARNGEASPQSSEETSEQAADNDIVRNAAANIQIHIPNNVWVKHRSANVELSGNVQVSKTSGGKPMITGIIEVIRGWVGFQGRRFTLTRGRVELTGGDKINPMLDIVAEYRVTNYLVNVTITGTAAKPTLTLKSEPQLDQADILSLLLFNKPISALGKGEQISLQQNAIDITTSFAASAIGTAVSQALGLQDLGIDIGDVDFSGGQLRYGRYISRNTFVSLGQDLTGKTGQEASAEYQITPEWKLSVTTSSKGERGIDLIWHKRY
jgi:autotransporter translocation and assembly factor TamB